MNIFKKIGEKITRTNVRKVIAGTLIGVGAVTVVVGLALLCAPVEAALLTVGLTAVVTTKIIAAGSTVIALGAGAVGTGICMADGVNNAKNDVKDANKKHESELKLPAEELHKAKNELLAQKKRMDEIQKREKSYKKQNEEANKKCQQTQKVLMDVTSIISDVRNDIDDIRIDEQDVDVDIEVEEAVNDVIIDQTTTIKHKLDETIGILSQNRFFKPPKEVQLDEGLLSESEVNPIPSKDETKESKVNSMYETYQACVKHAFFNLSRVSGSDKGIPSEGADIRSQLHSQLEGTMQ